MSCGRFCARPQSAEPIEEDDDGGLEYGPAAIEVGDLAPERRGGGRGQQVGGDHPGQLVQAAQFADDAWQRGTDDALIQRAKK